MEDNAVVVASLRQSCEVAARLGRVRFVEFEGDCALWSISRKSEENEC
jgi:hypothetical protein